MFSRIAAFLFGTTIACAAIAEQFTLPREALVQLPNAAAATEDPHAFAQRVGGVDTYPKQRGTFLLYRHGTLWYWFGPISNDRDARLDLSRVLGLIAEMRTKNRQRYRDASARILTLDSDDTLTNIEKNRGGIELGLLLDRMQNLERLKVLAGDLKDLEKKANVPPAQLAPEFRAANMRTLDLVLRDSEALKSSVSVLGTIPQIDAEESRKLRAEIGWKLLSQALSAGDIATMRANGADAAGLITMAAAADSVLRDLDTSGKSATQFKQQVDEARKALADDPKSITDDVVGNFGEIALAALGGNEARKQRLHLSSMAQTDLEAAYRRAHQQNLNGVADAIAKSIAKARARPMAAEANLGAPGQSTLIAMMQEGPANSHDVFASGVLPALRDIDLGVAAQYGLNGAAAKDLIPALAGNESDPAKRAQALKNATKQVQAALTNSLRGEIGAPTDPAGVPLTPELAELLGKAVERRGGKMPEGKPGATLEDAIAAAAGELARELADANGEGDISLSSADVRELGSQIAKSGTASGAPGATAGGTSEAGGGAQGGAQGGGQSNGNNSSSSDGKKGGNGQAKDGSGNLPLPGYMPLFELLARYISQQLGIDISVAKAILMIAYAIDPETFNKLAKALEDIHGQLVNAELAKGLNEVNKVLDLLDRAQSLYDQIEGSMANLVNKGVEPALKELAKRGADSLSKKAVAELAKKLNVDEKVIRALMQLPDNFNADGMKTVVREYAQDRLKAELGKRGINPAFADALVKGDAPRMRTVAEQLVDDAATRALKKQGLGEGTWQMIKSGSFDQAATRMKNDAQAAALNWARSQGFTAAEANALMNGDVNAAADLLHARGKKELEAQLARAQKLPEQMQRELESRGAEAAAELRKRMMQDLTKRGLDAKAADRLLNGDYPGFVSAVRKTGEDRVDAWARSNGFSADEARALSAADPKKAATLLAARGSRALQAQVARANNLAQEVQNAVAGLAATDVTAMQDRMREELKNSLKLKPAELEALRTANLGALAPAQFKAIVRDVAKRVGWDRAARHFGVTGDQLRAFTQSPDAVAEITRVAKLAPGEFVGKYREELRRQQNLVELTRRQEEQRVKEMLAAFNNKGATP